MEIPEEEDKQWLVLFLFVTKTRSVRPLQRKHFIGMA